MKNNFSEQHISLFLLLIFLVYGVFFWYPSYLKDKHLKEGWVTPIEWDCPEDHPIKANLNSMIYHEPWDQYWARTNAMNGKCFDTAQHAVQQGFRPIFGGIRQF